MELALTKIGEGETNLGEEQKDTEKRPVSGVSIALMLDTMELKNFEIQRLKSVVLKLQSMLEEMERQLSAKDVQMKRLTSQRDDAWEELAAIRRS